MAGSKELTALLTSLDHLGPAALSSCPGWNAHHVAATGTTEGAVEHARALAADWEDGGDVALSSAGAAWGRDVER